jgi:hypothetical protein
MKLCPLCSSTYADRVDFCFRDGTPLVRDGVGTELGARSEDLPTPESGKAYRDDTFDTEVLFDPDTGDYATTSPPDEPLEETDEPVDDPTSPEAPDVDVQESDDSEAETSPTDREDDRIAPFGGSLDDGDVDDTLLDRQPLDGPPPTIAERVRTDVFDEIATPVDFDLEGHPLADPLDAPEPPEAMGRAREVERIQSEALALHAKGAKALGPKGVVVPAPESAALPESDDTAITEVGPTAAVVPAVPEPPPAAVQPQEPPHRSPARGRAIAALAALALAVVGVGVLAASGSFGSRSTEPVVAAAPIETPTTARPIEPVAPVQEPVTAPTETSPPVVAEASPPESKPQQPRAESAASSKPAEPKKTEPPAPAAPAEPEPAVADIVVVPEDENPWGVPSAAAKGLLRIDGSPKGARVSVNDEPQGIVRDGAPVELEVSVGEDYRIRVEKDGYLAYSKVVSVHAKEPVSVPYDLKIAVTSGQARLVGEVGSTVYIDASTTPIPIPSSVQLSEGRHSFRVVLANGETITLAKTIAFDGSGVPPVVTLSSGLSSSGL